MCRIAEVYVGVWSDHLGAHQIPLKSRWIHENITVLYILVKCGETFALWLIGSEQIFASLRTKFCESSLALCIRTKPHWLCTVDDLLNGRNVLSSDMYVQGLMFDRKYSSFLSFSLCYRSKKVHNKVSWYTKITDEVEAKNARKTFSWANKYSGSSQQVKGTHWVWQSSVQ